MITSNGKRMDQKDRSNSHKTYYLQICIASPIYFKAQDFVQSIDIRRNIFYWKVCKQTSLTSIKVYHHNPPKILKLRHVKRKPHSKQLSKWGWKNRGWKWGLKNKGWKIGADDCGLTCWAALTGAPRSAAGRPEMEKEEVEVEEEEEEEDRHMEKNQHKRKWSLDFLGVRRSIIRDICNREGFCQTSPPPISTGVYEMTFWRKIILVKKKLLKF